MGWKHHTLLTLKALGILALGAVVIGVAIMSLVLHCASGGEKRRH